MSFKRGATLLLRDSLPPPEDPAARFDPSSPILPATEHVAITDHHAQVYERVGSFMFSFSAGSFFQNNNSILIPLTEYVREAIFPSTPVTTTPPPTHLVDTYCGSGLFGITLSPFFQKIAGVEISAQSIDAARKNAEMNGITGDKASWLVGKAENIFGDLPGYGFQGEQSCVVVDVSSVPENTADASHHGKAAMNRSCSSYWCSNPSRSSTSVVTCTLKLAMSATCSTRAPRLLKVKNATSWRV